MSDYAAPTIQVHVRCACASRPRKPPLHLVADTLAAIRAAIGGVLALDPKLPGVAAAQAKVLDAFDGSLPFQTWRCPKCQTIAEITVAAVHIAAPNPAESRACFTG